MSLSDQELQEYIGKNVRNVQKKLEGQGIDLSSLFIFI